MLSKCDRRAILPRSASVTQVLLRSTPITSPSAIADATAAQGRDLRDGLLVGRHRSAQAVAIASHIMNPDQIFANMVVPACPGCCCWSAPEDRSASPASGIA